VKEKKMKKLIALAVLTLGVCLFVGCVNEDKIVEDFCALYPEVCQYLD
jgi:outer membrane murein-binding lipoprotein Lpp